MKPDKKNISSKEKAVKKMLLTKLTLKSRVQSGEKLTQVAKELGVKIVQPL